MMTAGTDFPEYELRFSRRSRRIRISVLPGRVSVTAPAGVSRITVEQLVKSRSSWIREKLAHFEMNPGPSAELQAVPGGELWLFGEKYSIAPLPGAARPEVSGRELLLGEEWLNTHRMRTLLDEMLLERAKRISQEFAMQTGLSPSSIRLGNARTRWGSCSPAGRIMINRKLVHAPGFVIEYIVHHELMHLRHRNHSTRFWKDLCSLSHVTCEAKEWLRLRGAHLL